MPIDTSIYSITNQNPAEDYHKALTENVDRQAQGMKLSQLANQTTTANQQFSDEQAQRKALQQNTGPGGQIDQTGLMNSDFARQNPMMAKNLSNSITKVGLEGTTLKNEQFKDAYAHLTPDNYEQTRQGLIDSGHPEAKDWPPVYMESFRQKGLVGTMTADQQLSMQAAQRQNAFGILQKYAEKGVGAPEEIRQMAGFPPAGQEPQNAYHQESIERASKAAPGAKSILNLKPGEIQEMGEADKAGVTAYRDALKARSLNDPSYGTAGANLLAIQNANKVFEKYRDPKTGAVDYSKINTQDAHTLALEMAKAKKGGTPTEDEVLAELAPGAKGKIAMLRSKGFSGPVPMNEPEFYQGAHNYLNELKSNSMNAIQKAHQAAEMAARTTGISPRSLAMEKQAMASELEGKASGSYESPGKKSAIPEGRITVVGPDGTVGHIPKSQLQQALKQGYKQQ